MVHFLRLADAAALGHNTQLLPNKIRALEMTSLVKVGEVDSPSYSHGGYFGFAGGLASFLRNRHNLAHTHEDFSFFEYKLDVGETGSIGVGAAENHPTMAALGHVVENLLQRRADSCFYNDVLRVCFSSTFGIPACGATEVQLPRGIEWDIYVNVAHADTDTFGLKDIAVAHGDMMNITAEFFGLSSYARIAAHAFNASEWLVQYARVLLSLTDINSVPESKRATVAHWKEQIAGLSEFHLQEFYGTVWSILFCHEKEHLRLVLDIKSRYVVPDLLEVIISKLNAASVVVECIGSFKQSQLAGVHAFTQTVYGAVVPAAIKPLHFFHTVGDLLALGNEAEGWNCLFNAGSMLTHNAEGGLVLKDEVLDRLKAAVAKHKFKVGVYIAEQLIHPESARHIVALCNAHRRDLIGLGFAYGGVNGWLTTSSNSDTKEHVATGLGLQRLVGRNDRGAWF